MNVYIVVCVRVPVWVNVGVSQRLTQISFDVLYEFCSRIVSWWLVLSSCYIFYHSCTQMSTHTHAHTKCVQMVVGCAKRVVPHNNSQIYTQKSVLYSIPLFTVRCTCFFLLLLVLFFSLCVSHFFVCLFVAFLYLHFYISTTKIHTFQWQHSMNAQNDWFYSISFGKFVLFLSFVSEFFDRENREIVLLCFFWWFFCSLALTIVFKTTNDFFSENEK